MYDNAYNLYKDLGNIFEIKRHNKMQMITFLFDSKALVLRSVKDSLTAQTWAIE